MSKELSALTESVERLIAEHTRLRVENQSLTLRIRELEQRAASSSERVKQAKTRLDSLIAQLPLEAPEQNAPQASQTSLL
jgi:regulator of replication initiation timing